MEVVAKLAYKIWARYRYRHVLETIFGHDDLVVKSGPFAGMIYTPSVVDVASPWICGSVLIPKLLGCYEAELQSVLKRTLEKRYNNVVNIGCGEGYYAIGLARSIARVRVYAFDINLLMCRLCEDMACANGVADRVHVHTECDTNRLRDLITGKTLVVCDCEGCEVDLLRPDVIPGLTSSDVLVEMHDFIDAKASQTVLSRFRTTHVVELINGVSRDPTAFPVLHSLRATDRQIAVDEFRPNSMQWAFMTATYLE